MLAWEAKSTPLYFEGPSQMLSQEIEFQEHEWTFQLLAHVTSVSVSVSFIANKSQLLEISVPSRAHEKSQIASVCSELLL